MSPNQEKNTNSSGFLPSRLRAERKRLELQQKDVAALCGVTTKTIQRWERGIPVPSDKLELLFEQNFDPQYLFTGVFLNSDVDPKLKQLNSGERAKAVLQRVVEIQSSLGVEFNKAQLQTLMGYAFDHCPTQVALESFVRAAFEMSGSPLPENDDKTETK